MTILDFSNSVARAGPFPFNHTATYCAAAHEYSCRTDSWQKLPWCVGWARSLGFKKRVAVAPLALPWWHCHQHLIDLISELLHLPTDLTQFHRGGDFARVSVQTAQRDVDRAGIFGASAVELSIFVPTFCRKEGCGNLLQI